MKWLDLPEEQRQVVIDILNRQADGFYKSEAFGIAYATRIDRRRAEGSRYHANILAQAQKAREGGNALRAAVEALQKPMGEPCES